MVMGGDAHVQKVVGSNPTPYTGWPILKQGFISRQQNDDILT